MPITKKVNLSTTFGFQNHILPMTTTSKSKLLNFYIDFSGQLRHFPKKSKYQTLLDAVTMNTETAGKKTETFKYNRKIRNIRYTMLNSIFFEPDKVEIPVRYNQFNTHSENNFDEAKFQPADALESYRRILDIMGSRMVSNPVLKIELYTKNHEEIDSQRKLKISDYLTKIWKVSPSRIAIKGSNSEALNDNSVLIVPFQGSESVLMSVLRRDTTEKLLTDRIIFHFDFENTSGIEKWKFNLYSRSDTIIAYNGRKSLADVTYDIKQGYNDSILKNNFTFVLLVKGKVGEKDYFIPGKLMVNKTYTENISEEIYLVWDRPDNYVLSNMNRMICQRIKAKDYSANTVTINSYTGISGNARTSEKISRYRAIIVKRETELENAEINYFGENFQIYEFTTPEAEYYNNTVQIIVE